MSGWTARGLARLTGIPAATVGNWIARGLVTPEQCGRGGHLIFPLGQQHAELLHRLEARNSASGPNTETTAMDELPHVS